MDEWYDAIPILYRRFALAQHALTIILSNFPIQSTRPSTSSKRSTSIISSCSQKLYQAIHTLHRSYLNSPSIQSQAILLLNNLFSLPSKAWFEVFDDYHHKFHLVDQFSHHFYQTIGDRSFLEFCSDPELVGFIDLTVDRFGAWAIERWLDQRESLIRARTRWRSSQDARRLGLESSETDSDDGLNDEAIIEYDQQTSLILIKWIESLVMNCLPNSIDCQTARIELNSISRLLFDSLITTSNPPNSCSKDDNYFLSLLSIVVESHRLALFSLPMFNTGSVDLPGLIPQWSSPHSPMRLQALIPKLITHLDQRIFNKAAKLFLRAHRSTRLLAVLPGLLSTRHEAIIPGLDQLLRSLVDGDYSLELVGKAWVQSLLQTDLTSWWMRADGNFGNDDDGIDNVHGDRHQKGAQDIRSWLEGWLTILDDAEKLRLSLNDHALVETRQNLNQRGDDEENDPDGENQPEDESFTLVGSQVVDTLRTVEDEVKPEIIKCTCSNQNPLQPPAPVAEQVEDEDKPVIDRYDSILPPSIRSGSDRSSSNDHRMRASTAGSSLTRTATTTRSSRQAHGDQATMAQIRVVVPMKKRRRKTPLLLLPSSRSKRKKSMTPLRSACEDSNHLGSLAMRSTGIDHHDPSFSSSSSSSHLIPRSQPPSVRSNRSIDRLADHHPLDLGPFPPPPDHRDRSPLAEAEEEEEEDDFDVMDLLKS